mmetsp:Transcript_12507/g.29840  ORF Transcript_12507/g.29840 Transcript_12507/m.29840 type:complete len:836 (-) Transcript_12507:1583-4090(-)
MSNTQDSSSLFVSLPDLQAICNTSEQRGKELLEATNGSLERAIDLHFHQARDEKQWLNPTRQREVARPTNESDTDKMKKRLKPNVASADSPKKRLKEGSLHSFFLSARDKPSPTAHTSSIKAISDDCNSSEKRSTESSPKKGAASISPTKKESEVIHCPDEASLEMSFEHLANTLQTMCDTTKRTEKLKALKDFISDYAQDSDVARAVFSLTVALSIVLGNAVEESLGVSGRTVSSALQDSLGVSSRQLSKGYRQYGDLGDSAASFFQSKRYFVSANVRRSLSVVDVHDALRKVIVAEGNNAKKDIVSKLLHLCQSRNEVRFMVRLLIGNMRIGCNMKTVLAAIAITFQSHSRNKHLAEKTAIQLVQKTHDLCPDLEKILRALLLGGFERMENDCKMQLFNPIAPMLATPTHSLAEIDQAMTKMQKSAVLEWKYDGVRCQAHFGDENSAKCSLYSRHLLDTTAQYPDAVRGILNARKQPKQSDSFIIDAEIVGVEGAGEETRFLPFQDLATRRKKDDGTGVKVKVFCFDLMYLNGKSYVALPLWKRRDLLREHFNETNDFAFVTSKVLPTFDEHVIKGYLAESMRQGTEGLMVKMLGGAYEAGTRSQSWLKVKGDYVEGFADTIDVVPIGAWHGTGRKAEKGFLSPILLAVYDEDEDVYRSICRCMTFTDAMYTSMREFYLRGVPYPEELSSVENEKNKEKASQDPRNEDECLQDDSFEEVVSSADSAEKELLDNESSNCFANRPTSSFIVTNEKPPIWFKPLEVWEVSFADMSLSRRHTAGAGLVPDPDGRGIALRFPRFKRRRSDKATTSATTSTQIAAMFLNQAKQMKSFAR